MALPKWPHAAEPTAEAGTSGEPRRIGETPTDEERRARIRAIGRRVIARNRAALDMLDAHDRGEDPLSDGGSRSSRE
jgi:hypothetical protein